MSKLYSPIYNIDTTVLNINSTDTNIYGNLNIIGNVKYNSNIINNQNTSNILNNTTINGNLNVENNLIVNNTIYANHFKVINGVIDGVINFNGNANFRTKIQTKQIDMNGGNINISGGNINGPVRIFGAQLVNSQIVNTSSIITRNGIIFNNLDEQLDFTIKETNCTLPPGCTPTWIKVQLNGKILYLFSQSPVINDI